MNVQQSTKEEFVKGAMEEFKALRSEIQLRIDLRSKLIALCIALFGIIATLSVKGVAPVEVLLLYPVLSMFIAFEWTYHDLRIFAVGDYIKREIEPNVPGLNWQHYLDETRQYRRLRMTALGAGGIFVGASIIAIGMAAKEFKEIKLEYGELWYLFAAVDVSAVLGSIIALAIRRVNPNTYKKSSFAKV